MNHHFERFLSDVRERIDSSLSNHLRVNEQLSQHRLMEAMRYSVLNGGKRVRPALCFAAATVELGDEAISDKAVLDAACAVELVHGYSLVHDDLPAMDDDDLRRGEPTTHVKFDDATAILAGDALQTRAFEILAASEHLDTNAKIHCIQTLAKSAGEAGMCGGQAIDMDAVGKTPTLDNLSNMHRLKTGALIKASLLMGAFACNQDDVSVLSALTTYGEAIGLAFQVKDDILDATADTSTLGKRQGADAERDKPTYVSHLGVEGAEKKLEALHRQAQNSLETLTGSSQLLSDLTNYIVYRAA